MQLMVEGDQWEMYIPSNLAYGDGGSGAKIKGGDTLIFKMEILKIKGNKVPANRCDPATEEGCDEKEIKYIKKVSAKTIEEIKKELSRLEKMQKKKMTAKLSGWVNQRLSIVRKLVEKDEL